MADNHTCEVGPFILEDSELLVAECPAVCADGNGETRLRLDSRRGPQDLFFVRADVFISPYFFDDAGSNSRSVDAFLAFALHALGELLDGLFPNAIGMQGFTVETCCRDNVNPGLC